MIALNDLPTIVTAPGEYATRDGRRVTVHSVTDSTDPTLTAFRAKGAVWHLYRGVHRPRGLAIWHVSGRAYPLRESSVDIVARWEPAK